MSQHEERARAVKQARKLMEMTTSCGASEAEANFAMKRLSEIQAVYNLTLDEIVLENLEYKQISISATKQKGCPMMGLVTSIAKFTDTKVWFDAGDKNYKRTSSGRYRVMAIGAGEYKFFGLEPDIEMAKFLFSYIDNTREQLELAFKKMEVYTGITRRGGKRSALDSFRKGFNNRIRNKMFELYEERAEERAASTTGKDIVLDKESVRERKFKEQMNIKLTSRGATSGYASNSSAWAAGSRAAGDVSFDRPVGNDTASTLLLA